MSTCTGGARDDIEDHQRQYYPRVTLTTATYNYNPLYVTGTINTATGDGVNGDNTQAWTIGNTGTIKATARKWRPASGWRHRHQWFDQRPRAR